MTTNRRTFTATVIAVLVENFIADFGAAMLTFFGRIAIRLGRLLVAITGGREGIEIRDTDGPWTVVLYLMLITAFILSCFQWAAAFLAMGVTSPWYAAPLLGFFGSTGTQIVQGFALRSGGIVVKFNRYKKLSQFKRVGSDQSASLIDVAKSAGEDYNRAGVMQRRTVGFVAFLSWGSEFLAQCQALTWVFSWEPITWLALLGNVAVAVFCTALFEVIVMVIEKSQVEAREQLDVEAY